MIAVLSIIITAPLGAIGILGAGPLLLSKSKREESIAQGQSETVIPGDDNVAEF